MNTKKLLPQMVLTLGRVMPGLIFLVLTRQADANPTGMTVQSGTASAAVNGSQLTVTTGNNTFLNWQSFNIGAGESTVFNQPSAASIVWNRINDQNPSQIFGSLQANGVVVLLNSSGFYFGPNSFVSTAGLVVSTANLVPAQNAGGMWQFNGPPPLASIVNYGQIKIGQGGSCFLIADKVENHGSIEAPGGDVGLAAGKTVLLSERPDGRGMSMKVTLPQGSVDNYGTLLADGGTISLHAQVVNQNGFIQANTVKNDHGVIELVASDELNLGADSKILAPGGDTSGRSAGGQIMLKSANSFSDAAGSEISVAGGANGGNGGTVEISAPVMPAVHSAVDGTAQAGSKGGQLLLDPDYIVLDTSGADSAGSGTVGAGDNPGGTLALNVNSAFTGFSQITLQAAYDITLADNTAWNLSDSTGQQTGQLVLEAGRNILFGNYASLSDSHNWSVSLYAGVTDFDNRTVAPGAGSIYINSIDPNNPQVLNGYIQTAKGGITLVAGQDITLGTAYVNTTDGGNITAHALSGNIDTGGYPQGYVFQGAGSASDGYFVDPAQGLGGISTRAGGDVNLTAGGNIMSVLPARGGYYYDGVFYRANQMTFPNILSDYLLTAGSGAYGPKQGDVTIVAGGNVTGNYVVANGKGKIYAGVLMDANGNPQKDGSGNYLLGSSGSAGIRSDLTDPAWDLSLNLVKGGWSVTAAQNIVLDEVSNPNGEFNAVDTTSASFHAFDYAASAYVNLVAGNQVQLGESAAVLPRADNLSVPMIFPGILNILAGAGGVVLNGDATYRQLILYPSPLGGLTISTTGGGSLTGASLSSDRSTPVIFGLIVSDSGNTQYKSSSGGLFGINDHAATPIHLNSEQTVQLNISGDMNYVQLAASEAAEINVVGDLKDSRFQGMNLKDSDVTSINVGAAAKAKLEHDGILNPATDGGIRIGGNIIDRSAFTSIPLDKAPNLSVLADAIDNNINGTAITALTLLNSLFFTPAKVTSAPGLLTYQNISNVKVADVLGLLQHLTVYKRNGDGSIQLDSNHNPVTTTVAVIDAATADALLAKYNSLGQFPSGAGGLVLGGGGTFSIKAANMDLGTTAGVQSLGVGLYTVAGKYTLGNYFTQGANIDVDLSGDLTMYSSAIASLNGGDISITAGGTVNVGSPDFTVNSLGARGIYTADHGDVSVIANGSINVNGSRIAAYDGGNVTVESLNGDINAGSGGSGYVVVSSFMVDGSHNVTASSPTIPGSGILATTFPDDKNAVVGNILVETPNGNINASSGGIVQLPLNNAKDNEKAVIAVLAGYELRDSAGHAVDAGNIANGTPVKISDNRDVDASGSGIIGQNVVATTSGKFKGVVFGKGNVSLTAPTLTDLLVLGKTVTTEGSLGPTVTLIGTDSVNTGGSTGGAQILSQDANGGGSTFAQGTAANATSTAASANEANTPVAKNGTGTEEEPTKKKEITLARKVSRVTVILPAKN